MYLWIQLVLRGIDFRCCEGRLRDGYWCQCSVLKPRRQSFGGEGKWGYESEENEGIAVGAGENWDFGGQRRRNG